MNFKNKEEEYLHLNEDLENYFSNTIIPQLFVDAKMVLRKFTPPAMTQFTFTEKDINRDFHEVKDNIKFPTIIENIEEVMKTAEILEKEIQTVDGKWYQMNILPYIVRKENRTNGVIITFVDITERITNLRDLERLNAQHDTLMYALAHDLRQPISNIVLLKEGLQKAFEHQDTVLFNQCKDHLSTAISSITSLTNSFVKENETHPDLNASNQRVNIQSIVEEVLTSFKHEIYNDKITLQTEFLVTEIKFSRTNLRSIVYNLLSNAIKFKHPENPLKIEITTQLKDDFIIFKVKDTGLGIPPEHQKKIFNKTERLQAEVEGTGMGLYIIKRMVENNNGKLEVKSKVGAGSTFSVYFPVK